MTLNDLFNLIADHPGWILTYLLFIPLTAFIAGVIGKGEGHLSPWKYLYSTLVFLICIPGIFAISLNVYLFLFERQSILDSNLYTQVLPVISMIITLLLIRSSVDLDRIPGFDKLGGLILVLISVFAIMWIVDRTRLLIFSYLPFSYAIIFFIVLLVLLLLGWRRLTKN
jgi:hypothetical protein